MAKSKSKKSKKEVLKSLREFIRSKGHDYLKDGNIS